MRPAALRLRVLARRVRDLWPVSSLGALVCAAAAGGILWTRAHLDYVLLVCGAAGLAVVGLATLSTVLVAVILRQRLGRALRVAGPPLAGETGVDTPTGLAVPGPWAHLPLLAVDITWIQPAGAHARLGAEGEAVIAGARASVDAIERRFVVRDAFGLAELAFRRTEPRRARFLPAIGRLGGPPLERALARGDEQPHPHGSPEGDRADLRRYVPGDSLRHLLWKTYARTGQLMVRTPERAVSPARRTLACLCTGAGDEPTAAAARAAVETGALGREWALAADGTPGLEATAPGAIEAICRSRGASPGEALERFFAEVARSPGARVVLFVPGRPGPWLERLGPHLRKHARSHALDVVIGVDTLSHDAAPSWLARVLLRPQAAAPPARELEGVLERLSAVGASAIVLSRTTGRAFRRLPHKAPRAGAHTAAVASP